MTAGTTARRYAAAEYKYSWMGIAYQIQDSIMVDKINPSISADNSSSTWKTANISITLSVSDDSYIASAKYVWDNSSVFACTNGTTFTNSQVITLSTE